MLRIFCSTRCLLLACCCLVLGLFALPVSGAGKSAKRVSDPLVIHEWGTFTCLQDERGESIAGVNTDDEPVPQFVHRISDLIPRPSELAPVYYKGVPRSHRKVHMRLETPVVYFYPPAQQQEPLHVNVKVGFRGGWLTEYYPHAEVNAPGLRDGNFDYGRLTTQTRGTLEWNDLTIGAGGRIPETNAPVWLAPRDVPAATVRAPGGEAEKYLFYRGVGNIRSPLRVTRAGNDLLVHEDLDASLGLRAPLSLREIWLVHVREDGTVAFRSLGGAEFTGEKGHVVLRTALAPARGTAGNASEDPTGNVSRPRDIENLLGEYSTENLARLRREMRAALITDGLFEPEADAMLKTWELAYFKSAGLRLFYLLPQQWTDAVLPLECDRLSRVVRTMVGRIEMVTPRQRDLLRQIGRSEVSSSDWFFRSVDSRSDRNEAYSQLWEGKVRLSELNVPVPEDYQAYLALGRFRNALLLDEEARRSSEGIRKFNEAYAIQYYAPDDEDSKTAAAK